MDLNDSIELSSSYSTGDRPGGKISISSGKSNWVNKPIVIVSRLKNQSETLVGTPLFELRINGEEVISKTIFDNVISPLTEFKKGIWVGAGINGASQFSGDVAEILLYNSAISDDDLLNLEDKLKEIWNHAALLSASVYLWL